MSKAATAKVVPIEDLMPDPGNARFRDARAQSAISRSMKELGAGRSVVIDADGVVRAGNGTLEAAKAAGISEALIIETDGKRLVVVKRPDWTAEQALAYAIADNKTSELSQFDPDLLKGALETLAAHAVETSNASLIEATGFDDAELGKVLKIGAEETIAVSGYRRALPDVKDPPVPELPKKAETRRGDVWILGGARLMCGDGRNEEHVAKLFGDTTAPLLMSDPPYCSGGFQEAGRAAGTFGDIASDQLSSRGYIALMKQTISATPANARPRGVYLFTDWRMWTTLFDVVESAGYPVRSMIVWNKGSPGMGSLWRTQHELVMFGTRDGKKREKGQAAWGNVIDCPRSGNEHHYTQKPVALMSRLMEGDAVSPRGKCAIYDPFAGSGSTLLAAEQAERLSFGMECEPKWCDTVVRRWEELTSKKAERTRA